MLTKQQLDMLVRNLNNGQHRQVIAEGRRLIKLNPTVAGLHEILGLAYAQSGDPQNAVKSFTRAIKLMPGLKSAHFNLARVYLGAGRTQLAIDALRRLVRADQTDIDACHLLGIALFRHGDLAAAAAQFATVIDHAPQNHEALFYLGRIARVTGDDDAALNHFLAVLDRQPGQFEATFNIGNIHRDNRCPTEALAWFDKALAIKPDHLDSLINRGTAQVLLGRPEAGLRDFETCLAIDPGHLDAFNNLGLALIEIRKMDEAMAMFDRALAHDPDFIDAEFSKFVILALQNRYDEALPLAEIRFDPRRSDPVSDDYATVLPRWDGGSLAGRHLLVHAEQGLGDTLMFLRFMTQIPADVASLTLAVQDPVYDLIAAQEAGFKVIRMSQAKGWQKTGAGRPDLRCAMMSLPVCLAPEGGATLTAPARYLEVPPDHQRRWATRLGKTTRPRVGFVFQGNRGHRNDLNRSVELHRFLTALPEGCDYHFLGIDLTEKDRAGLEARADITLHTDEIGDFRDTAALVSQMDRVVAVDTSVAHLACALGIDTTILLPFTPDWRWGLEGEDSFWYPTAKLVRQPAIGDWDRPLSQVATALRQVAKAH